MIGNIELDKMSAQALALEIAAYAEQRLALGADAALLAIALSIGSDLLRRAQSAETAAKALALAADDVANADFEAAEPTVN